MTNTMTVDFRTELSKRILLFDGAIGTMLQAKGLDVGEAPENWNIGKPELVEEVHKAYVNTGCDIVTTNSFGGSPHKLTGAGISTSAYEINRMAAEIAKRAAQDQAFVAGSIGPTGAMLLMGEISEDDILAGFSEQVRGLVDGGADLIIIETMSDLDEAKLAVKAAKQSSSLPVIASMTFEKGKQGYRTMMGVDVAAAVAGLSEAEADILGTNCGAGIDRAVEIVGEMRACTDLPILAEPNAGLPKLVDGRTVFEQTPAAMAELLPELMNAGAQIVGGCCGTTPKHIEMFRQMIDKTY